MNIQKINKSIASVLWMPNVLSLLLSAKMNDLLTMNVNQILNHNHLEHNFMGSGATSTSINTPDIFLEIVGKIIFFHFTWNYACMYDFN